MVTFTQWRQEQESLRKLRAMVDRICADIAEGRIKDEAELDLRIVAARAFCQGLLPDKVEVFNLIYQSRCQRLWKQFGPETQDRRLLHPEETGFSGAA
jgi:hypothetical protein